VRGRRGRGWSRGCGGERGEGCGGRVPEQRKEGEKDDGDRVMGERKRGLARLICNSHNHCLLPLT
jgi:hypothetical protein